MRKIRLLCAVALLLLLFINSKCKKSDPESQLPPETTTGAGTFGCKIDGKVFVPRSGRGQPGLYVRYDFNNVGPQLGWYLNIVANDHVPQNSIGVNIVTDSLLLEEGLTYGLKIGKGFAAAEHHNGLKRYGMRTEDSGSLIITKHDNSLRILSGLFSFTATTFDNSKVEITEGRFDVRY